MTWYETENGVLLNLNKADCIGYGGFGGHDVFFSDSTAYKLSETDYENIKNILLNGGK